MTELQRDPMKKYILTEAQCETLMGMADADFNAGLYEMLNALPVFTATTIVIEQNTAQSHTGCAQAAINSVAGDGLGTSKELVEMAARLAMSELRANQLEAQFKAQCKITAAALEERAKMAAPSTSQPKQVLEKFDELDAPSTSQPLTDVQICAAWLSVKDPLSLGSKFSAPDEIREFARAIEAAHGIKGGA